MALDIITDPLTKKQFSRDTSIAGSTYAPYTVPSGTETTIKTSQIGTTPLNIPPVPPPTPTTGNLGVATGSVLGQMSTDMAYTPSTNPDKETATGYLKTFLGNIGKQAEEENKIYKEEQLAQKKQRAQALSTEIDIMDKAYRDEVNEIKKNRQGQFGGGMESDIARATDRYQNNRANAALVYKVAAEDYNGAAEIVNQKVSALKDQNAQYLQAYQLLIDSVNNDMTESEQLQAQAMYTQKANEAKALSDTYASVLQAAVQNQAPASILSAIDTASRTPGATAASIYEAAGKYAAENTYQSVKGENGQLYTFNPSTGEYALSPISPSGDSFSDDAIIQSYARQYAASGSLTNIPEEYHSEAIRQASQYVQPGDIIDKTTGVPGSLSDIARTKIQVRKRFKELTDTMNANFYGANGKPLTKGLNQIKETFRESGQAAAFNLAQKQFEQLLRSDITGAAFSPEEILEYQSYLPKQITGKRDLPGGVSQETRLKTLTDFARNALNSELQAYNAEIVPEFDLNEYNSLIDEASPEQRQELEVSSVAIPSSARLAYVNNNPGNLRFAGQPGAEQGEGGFARFRSAYDGFDALVRQVALDATRGHTLSSFISKFAPPSENDTETYIKQIAKAVGAKANTLIAKLDKTKLAKAIAWKESNTRIS